MWIKLCAGHCLRCYVCVCVCVSRSLTLSVCESVVKCFVPIFPLCLCLCLLALPPLSLSYRIVSLNISKLTIDVLVCVCP